MTFTQSFFKELTKTASKSEAIKAFARRHPYMLGGAALGGLIGAAKGRSDAMSYVTYHRLKEEDKKKMRRARMLSTGLGGMATGAGLGYTAQHMMNG